MPINYSNDRLLDVMNRWQQNNTQGAVILVDETTGGGDASRDRETRHRMQSALLVRAGRMGLPVFIVQYGMNGAHGQRAAFAGGLGADLDAAIPGGTNCYDKGALETNGFVNVQLVADMAAITDVIIMGQSVNACCAATANGAAGLGKNVHTCDSILRGGNVNTTAPLGFLWPNNTTVYSAL